MNQQTFAKFQSDIQNMANNIMTQAICAEKGINYNQLLQAAQAAQLQAILQQDEQRRVNQVIANHYGAQETTGFFGKIKKAVSGVEQPLSTPMPLMVNNPFVNQMMQQPATTTPNGMVMQPVVQPATQPVQDTRVAKLEQEMNEIKDLLTVMAQSLAGAQQQQPMQQQSNAGNNIPLK